MNNIIIKDIVIVKNTVEPYLKYTILDSNNKKHIFRVNSLKQLKYLIEDLKIME